MERLTAELEIPEQGTMDSELLGRAFGLGWAAADESHLPALAEALARLLDVAGANVEVADGSGEVLMEFSFPPQEARREQSPQLVYVAEEQLGEGYILRLTVESAVELSEAQTTRFGEVTELVRLSLECILVGQRDRAALGEPFAGLTEREWNICQALEKPNGEKQIADLFSWSRHTLHSYIKSMYKKLQVQSRLQLLDQLKRARDGLRRRTLEGFGVGTGRRGVIRRG